MLATLVLSAIALLAAIAGAAATGARTPSQGIAARPCPTLCG